uniref:Bifunctional inhibitor/plant lipid transfer protein/seed storage helical domain-containing protein n=1 Tax=Kalanchoe fedtschenkoi TaxID=63787 RepID=A0A7N0TYW8_KALFE
MAEKSTMAAAATLFTIFLISWPMSAISDQSPETVFDYCADYMMRIYARCKPYATGESDLISQGCCTDSGYIQDMARVSMGTPQNAWYRCEIYKRAAIKNKFVQERAERIPELCWYRPIFMPFVPNIDCYKYWPTNSSSVNNGAPGGEQKSKPLEDLTINI